MPPTPPLQTRAVLWDISRCRVPTMQTLEYIVRTLAALGINQLQLYTEHTFAWTGHEPVWKNASPITPDEARALDALCASLGIELVPCLNTLAHMERWLTHPEYTHLAETTGHWSFETDDGRTIPRSAPSHSARPTRTPSNSSKTCSTRCSPASPRTK